MMSHDAYTIGISRVLTITQLQQLKLEALIPAPDERSRVQIPWTTNVVEVFIVFLNLKIAKELGIFKG